MCYFRLFTFYINVLPLLSFVILLFQFYSYLFWYLNFSLVSTTYCYHCSTSFHFHSILYASVPHNFQIFTFTNKKQYHLRISVSRLSAVNSHFYFGDPFNLIPLLILTSYSYFCILTISLDLCTNFLYNTS